MALLRLKGFSMIHLSGRVCLGGRSGKQLAEIGCKFFAPELPLSERHLDTRMLAVVLQLRKRIAQS